MTSMQTMKDGKIRTDFSDAEFASLSPEQRQRLTVLVDAAKAVEATENAIKTTIAELGTATTVLDKVIRSIPKPDPVAEAKRWIASQRN